ncbi:MAG: Gfo/Idh/MocA family oxidoreductase [Anaerocolumna sp.]|jgi:predicted dehydrogenase|nr:Gfo/Idh/MocA family oxidoreductase [Anaerocolumna sp.]
MLLDTGEKCMKLGILGTGMIVEELFKITSYLVGIEMTAICSVRKSADAIREIADKNNIQGAFNNYEEFLESEIDTVYIALPNTLHFEFAKTALQAGKNVIIEKPFTTNYKEAELLSGLAREKELFLFEAITTLYLPNYKKIKELVPTLGNIKIIQCNYSQYSSRYNSFKEGNVLPAFDPVYAGGALMDLNIYNIHYVVGLFGRPNNVSYFPNITKGIDTSGILILEYGSFQCTLIGAKDCKAPIANNIQGDKGCIYLDNPTNVCKRFEVLMNEGTASVVNENKYEHRMVHEFLAFEEMITNNSLEECYQLLSHTLTVCEVQTIARSKAGILFEADKEKK